MSCGESGSTKYVYTGNQVGLLNYVGLYNFVAGGTSGLSAGQDIGIFTPAEGNIRPWLRKDAVFNEQLLDAAYPTIDLQWFADIYFDQNTLFRVSDRAFYVQDEDGVPRFYDARCERSPSISVTVGEWLNPNYEVSDLSLVLNNRDGFYNEYLPFGSKFRSWSGVRVVIKIGFGDKLSNYMTLFEGQVTTKQGLNTSRDSVEIRCYDKLDQAEVTFPPRTFSSDIYPDIGSTNSGKQIPIVYGDWTNEVTATGSVPAICTNALESDPAFYSFKISDTTLESLDGVWLHRSGRTEADPDGPIALSDTLLDVNLDDGSFKLDTSIPFLDTDYVLIKDGKGAVGSTANTITSNSDLNFVARGVQPGDFITIKNIYSASVGINNLKFVSVIPGAPGATISIEAITLAYDPYLDTDAGQAFRNTPQVLVTGNAIQIGYRTYTDFKTNTQVVGANKASQIRKALSESVPAKALVKVDFIGSIPILEPPGTKVSAVVQPAFSPTFLVLSVAAELPYIIQSVTQNTVTVSGPPAGFFENIEYTLLTSRYRYQNDDKFTVKCVGKNVQNISTQRISDVSSLITKPYDIALSSDNTFWLPDDATQKIYNVSLKDKKIRKQFTYASISAGMTSVRAISTASDNKVWVADSDNSTLYRIDATSGAVVYSQSTLGVTGINANLGNITGISVQADNQVWIVDESTGQFYLVNFFSNVTPLVVDTFNASAFDVLATSIQSLSYSNFDNSLSVIDGNTLKYYNVDTDGVEISSYELAEVNPGITFPTGVAIAPDTTLFFLDSGTLSIYNYVDDADVNSNPAWIARDLLQNYAGLKYEEFDLSWNETARQLSTYKTRSYISEKSNLITTVNKVLRQVNTVFFTRFTKYSLFYITFDNFTTNGKKVGEKDLKVDTFKPMRETNQYFNSATCGYSFRPFSGRTTTSDTYVSPSAIAFAGKEVNRKLDLPDIYRTADVDKLMPLYVRLSAADPEFIDVTFGFRMIRSQMQDFLSLTFDGDTDPLTGRKSGGRRYNAVPCMIRKISYNLDEMSVSVKLWSLGTTAFGDYPGQGNVVGGENELISLSNIGRVGRISPVGQITGSTSNTLTLADVGGFNAENRVNFDLTKSWQVGQSVSLVDAATGLVDHILSIESISGQVITFTSLDTIMVNNSDVNSDGFVETGHILKHSNYDSLTTPQKKIYASFTRPTTAYPQTQGSETDEQRNGAHSFGDGGLPYVLYPEAYVGV